MTIVRLQWLVGNVVGRDDTLYARMKQRDLDGHETMWEPIFVDDAAIGLSDQKNKVLQMSNDTYHSFNLESLIDFKKIPQQKQ